MQFNSLSVLTSPTLGGLVKVSFSQVKHWGTVHDPHSLPESGYSICAVEDEESEDTSVPVQLPGSTSTPEEENESRGAGDEHQGAGDGQQQEAQGGTRGEEDQERAARPQTRAKSRREREGARDQAPERPTQVGPQGQFAPSLQFPSLPSSVLDRSKLSESKKSKFQKKGVLPVASQGSGPDAEPEPVSIPVPSHIPSPVSVPVVVYSDNEAATLGLYNVEAILAHRYKSGWKFLVKWVKFPIHRASWEPVRSFLLPRGKINTIFQRYVEENGLTEMVKLQQERQKAQNTQP